MFFNFRPSMVERSLPDAWGFASPADVLRARSEGAAAALRGILPSVEEVAVPLVPLLTAAAAGVSGAGRPLFAANRAPDLRRGSGGGALAGVHVAA